MLKEASMNISMTGNTSSEVLELMAILKNAGLDTAHPVTDMDINQPMPDEGEHMCPACAAAHSMDTPCGEAVEEEYANSPDEEYQDDSYMLQDLSGGLNRKKERAAQRVKDPAVAFETKLKAILHNNLIEKYAQISERDLNRMHRPKTGNKRLAHKGPMSVGKAKAPGTAAAPGKMAAAPGTAAAPGKMAAAPGKMAKMPGTAAAPGMKAAAPKAALSPDIHAMLKQVFAKQYKPERAKAMYDFLQNKTGDAMSYLRSKTGQM